MSPDPGPFLDLLQASQRRCRLASALRAALVGSAASGVVLTAARLAGLRPGVSRMLGLAVLVTVAVSGSVWWWRRWTLARVAAALESRSALDNLVVTAEEIVGGRRTAPHPIVLAELIGAATSRLRQTPPAVSQPLARDVVLAAACLTALLVLAVLLPAGPTSPSTQSDGMPEEQGRPPGPTDLRVVITPPAYTKRPVTEAINPTAIEALEGSRVRLEMARGAARAALIDLAGRATPFTPTANTLAVELVAVTSRPLVVRRESEGGAADRLLQLRVQPDHAPVVRIERPARDLLFPEASGQVDVAIDARDDLGLAALSLRYTRMSGSGEAFTFEEGEWPVRVDRDADGHWSGHAILALSQLKLQDGDTLVYRALASDARPGADPAASDTFLIEVGRLAGVASTGFALPDDRDRQAISQQMVIIKTERLEAQRGTLPAQEFREQARLLAVEQRMVKAEFVFMTGGEVADEVEEAEKAHELAEGRLENAAHVELLIAIREMSRAEARLNDGDTTQALPLERAALRALQRAFDWRRYLLRTLPERTRIDLARRLTGELMAARSSGREHEAATGDPSVTLARALLGELSNVGSASEVSLVASRIMAIDPASESLQQAALQLSTALDQQAREAAVRQAQAALIDAIRLRMGRPTSPRIPRDPLSGHLVEELRRPSGGGR